MTSYEYQPGAGTRAAIFVVAVLAVSMAIGWVTAPGEWYASLEKPPFNPPGWLFGPVWTVLYILIAIAGWRIWQRAPRSGAMRSWISQMVLNWCWSPAFFTMQAPWLAFAIIVVLLASIIAFIGLSWAIDRKSAFLFLPYAGWVTFATLLNGSIAAMN